MAGLTGSEFVSPIFDVGWEISNQIDITNHEVVICEEMLEELLMLFWMMKHLLTQETLHLRIRLESVDRRRRRGKSERFQDARSGTGPHW